MNSQRLILSMILAGALLCVGACSSDKTTSSSPLPSGRDDAPPLPPTGLSAPDAKISATGFLLTWNRNTEADLHGYRVYLYDPSPERENAYVLLNSDQLIAFNGFPAQWDTPHQVWLRVTAVDITGNESAMSSAFYLSPTISHQAGDRADRPHAPSEQGSYPLPPFQGSHGGPFDTNSGSGN
jgi:hypothetical protein